MLLAPTPEWYVSARCRGIGVEQFVPADMSVEPPPIVTELCSSCPVAADCEQHGRSTNSSGWWGGVFLVLGHAVEELGSLKLWMRPVARSSNEGVVICALGPRTSQALTLGQVNEIKHRLLAGERHQTVADEYNVGRATIGDIATGRTWASPNSSGYKLSDDDVAEIRRRLAAGEMGKLLAQEYGVTSTTISRIKRGRSR